LCYSKDIAAGEEHEGLPMKPDAWMTEHESGSMLWPTREEALTYCDEHNEPIALGRCDALLKRLQLYEAAIKEAEAILGGEYAMQYGPFFELVEAARGVD
jgi:hypothetical protein